MGETHEKKSYQPSRPRRGRPFTGQPRWGWRASGGFAYRRLKPAATHGWAPLGPLVKAYLSAYGVSPPATQCAPLRGARLRADDHSRCNRVQKVLKQLFSNFRTLANSSTHTFPPSGRMCRPPSTSLTSPQWAYRTDPLFVNPRITPRILLLGWRVNTWRFRLNGRR